MTWLSLSGIMLSAVWLFHLNRQETVRHLRELDEITNPPAPTPPYKKWYPQPGDDL